LPRYWKKLHASKLLCMLKYLKHILWPPVSEKKLVMRHKLDCQIILLEGFNKIKVQNKLLPIPRLLYASTTPSVRTYTKVWSDLAESYPSKSTIYKNKIHTKIYNYQQKVKLRIKEGLLYGWDSLIRFIAARHYLTVRPKG
jgi:hypothetical protein